MNLHRMNDIFRPFLMNLKNIIGWKTNRKIVVLAFDDYGNVRVDSKRARELMDKEGLKKYARFDLFDSLENREDLEMMYEALSSAKDLNGSSAKLTAFSVPCNIDFEKVAENGFDQYYYEFLPVTFEKMAIRYPGAYAGSWSLWKEGMSRGLISPQFHGREHLNLRVFEEKLRIRDKEIMSLLQNRSYTGISDTGYSTIAWPAAFDFWDFEENLQFRSVIQDGIAAFEKVFGTRPVNFNAPGSYEHHVIHEYLYECGIRYIDTSIIKKEHQGEGKYKNRLYYTGQRNHLGMIYNVRNVVFEPTEKRGLDWVNFALNQIESAFRWRRPAVISSHRVNFCGHIDENNRRTGIGELKKLLGEMIRRWPDIEFMSSSELMDIVASQNKTVI